MLNTGKEIQKQVDPSFLLYYGKDQADYTLPFYWFLRSSAAAQTVGINCDEMGGDRLTVCEQELLWAFARLVSISSNFMLYR